MSHAYCVLYNVTAWLKPTNQSVPVLYSCVCFVQFAMFPFGVTVALCVERVIEMSVAQALPYQKIIFPFKGIQSELTALSHIRTSLLMESLLKYLIFVFSLSVLCGDFEGQRNSEGGHQRKHLQFN